MYIMKCDRCGKEKKIKSLLPIFGKEDDPRDSKKYSIIAMGEFREITLCKDCEAALEKWIVEPRCDNCNMATTTSKTNLANPAITEATGKQLASESMNRRKKKC